MSDGSSSFILHLVVVLFVTLTELVRLLLLGSAYSMPLLFACVTILQTEAGKCHSQHHGFSFTSENALASEVSFQSWAHFQ
jgi:hypothetical protein